MLCIEDATDHHLIIIIETIAESLYHWTSANLFLWDIEQHGSLYSWWLVVKEFQERCGEYYVDPSG